MSQYDPNLDPNIEINRIPPSRPVYTETIETVVVRPESNTGWWVAGILSAIVLIALFWVLASRGNDDTAELELARAQAEAAEANANADQAVIEGQIAGARQSVDFARADAARAQAEAARAIGEARTAQAEASRPVIIEVPAPPAPAPTGSATITSTSPQN